MLPSTSKTKHLFIFFFLPKEESEDGNFMENLKISTHLEKNTYKKQAIVKVLLKLNNLQFYFLTKARPGQARQGKREDGNVMDNRKKSRHLQKRHNKKKGTVKGIGVGKINIS